MTRLAHAVSRRGFLAWSTLTATGVAALRKPRRRRGLYRDVYADRY